MKKISILQIVIGLGIVIVMIVFFMKIQEKESTTPQKLPQKTETAKPVEKAQKAVAAETQNQKITPKPEKPAVPQDIANKPRYIKTGYYFLIEKGNHTLTIYKDGKVTKKYSVGTGRNSGDKEAVGDCRTPEGHFYIARIVDSSKWAHDFHDGKGTIEGAYGPWFLGLYTGADATFSKKSWTGIAIHGTHDDSSIGKNVSEGCIRMHNPEITEVHALAVTQNQIPVDIIQ